MSSKKYSSIYHLKDRPHHTATHGRLTVFSLTMFGFSLALYTQLCLLIIMPFSLNVASSDQSIDTWKISFLSHLYSYHSQKCSRLFRSSSFSVWKKFAKFDEHWISRYRSHDKFTSMTSLWIVQKPTLLHQHPRCQWNFSFFHTDLSTHLAPFHWLQTCLRFLLLLPFLVVVYQIQPSNI